MWCGEFMAKKYIAITVCTKEELNDLQLGKGTFFNSFTTALDKAFDYKIDTKDKINLKLRENNLYSYDSLIEAQTNTNHLQVIVEFDDETKNVTAIHESYFTQSKENSHRVDTANLYYTSVKYAKDFENRKRIIQSLSYGLLKNIANHNPANIDNFERGLALAEFLHRNPPKELCKIVQKSIDPKAYGLFFVKNKSPLTLINDDKNLVKQRLEAYVRAPTALPQVNFDDFDIADMEHALKYYGTFEIVGPTIDQLNAAAQAALDKTKDILNLDEAILEKVTHKGFNGFQNVHKESIKRAAEGKGVVRNQIAYHFKPYEKDSSRIPEGVEVKAFEEYYQQGMAVLRVLYRKIATGFITNPNKVSNCTNGKPSVLSTRKYFPAKDGETGIPAHSDYGLLTLVVSDKPGLEVQKDGHWINAPAGSKMRFFINVGDSALFQMNNPSYKVGMHRVPNVNEVRLSLALFLNPPLDEKMTLPNGVEETFQSFLFNYLSSDTSPIKVKKPS
jgi:isopenicillin N synthase-like dioxygenase